MEDLATRGNFATFLCLNDVISKTNKFGQILYLKFKVEPEYGLKRKNVCQKKLRERDISLKTARVSNERK